MGVDEIMNCEEKRDGEECTSRALHALNVSRRENGVVRENMSLLERCVRNWIPAHCMRNT